MLKHMNEVQKVQGQKSHQMIMKNDVILQNFKYASMASYDCEYSQKVS